MTLFKTLDFQQGHWLLYKTDPEIDQMIFELYGLSEDEVKILEGQYD